MLIHFKFNVTDPSSNITSLDKPHNVIILNYLDNISTNLIKD